MLQGETLAWLKLADNWNCPIGEARRRCTSREFVLHLEYERWKEDNPGVMEHYLAQIAHAVWATQSKKPQSVKLKEFLIKWIRKKRDPGERMDKKTAVKRAKLQWFHMLGMPVPDEVKNET